MKKTIGDYVIDVVGYGIGIVFVVGVIVLIAWGVEQAKQNAPAPQPPAINAPLLEIVRWCESHARESYTVSEPRYNAQTKKVTIETVTRWKDSPEMFIDCMQRYEYQVKR